MVIQLPGQLKIINVGDDHTDHSDDDHVDDDHNHDDVDEIGTHPAVS